MDTQPSEPSEHNKDTTEASEPTPASLNNNQHRRGIRLSVAWIIVLVVLLLAALSGTAYMYHQLNNSPAVKNRTVQVTGEATLSAEPDQLVFTPYYAIRNADRQAALAAIASKSTSVVDGLKKLGVAESAIKTNSSGYGAPDSPVSSDASASSAEIAPSRGIIAPGGSEYNLQVTVTVNDKTLAQKVQDYLVTTSPSGTVTPSASFSTIKRKELESKARDEATKDARAKADQSAKNLGFRVGSVKSVTDGNGFNGGPITAKPMTLDAQAAGAPERLQVLPGQNDFAYSVTVVYFVR